EWIPDVLAFELQSKFRKIHRKISVWFAVLGDEHSGQVRSCIQANQHLDGTIVSALERLQFGGPEYVPRNHRRARAAGVSNEMRQWTGLLRRKRRSGRKHALELPLDRPYGRGLH